MTAIDFADQLDQASLRVAQMKPHEVAILLRRASIRIRTAGIEPAEAERLYLNELAFKPMVEAKMLIAAASEGMKIEELIPRIVEDWLISSGWIDQVEIEEDSETEGRA